MSMSTSAAPAASIDASKIPMPTRAESSVPREAVGFAQTFRSTVAGQAASGDNSPTLDATAVSDGSVRDESVDVSREGDSVANGSSSSPSAAFASQDEAIIGQVAAAASAPTATKADPAASTHSLEAERTLSQKEPAERKSTHHSDREEAATTSDSTASTAAASMPVQQAFVAHAVPCVVDPGATAQVQEETKTTVSGKPASAVDSKPKDRAASSVDVAATVTPATPQTQALAVSQTVNAPSSTPAKTVEPLVAPGSAGVAHTVLTAAPVTAKPEQRTHTENESTAAEPTLTSMDWVKSNQLEVGVRGGEFGWVKVRAEVGADGSVNAYLRAPASAAAELHAQAPMLHAYLDSQSVHVQSVQVETGRSSAAIASDGGSGDGASQANDQRTRNAKSARSSMSTPDASTESAPLSWMPGPASGVAGTGSWLSVRA